MRLHRKTKTEDNASIRDERLQLLALWSATFNRILRHVYFVVR